MPRFLGEHRQTVEIAAPLAKALEHFASREAIVRNTDKVEKHEIRDDGTLRMLMEEENNQGIRFQGDYVQRYEIDGNTVKWSTTESQNMWGKGTARFTELGDNRVRMDYHETIEVEMNLNRFLAAIAKPIANREIRKGIEGFVAKMTKDLERQ